MARDDAQHYLKYRAQIPTFPFFVRDVANRWQVERQGETSSQVHIHLTVDIWPVFAQLIGPFLKRKMSKTIDIGLEELKYYAETGQIHPRKTAMREASRTNHGLKPRFT